MLILSDNMEIKYNDTNQWRYIENDESEIQEGTITYVNTLRHIQKIPNKTEGKS